MYGRKRSFKIFFIGAWFQISRILNSFVTKVLRLNLFFKAGLWIRILFMDPDPAVFLDLDPYAFLCGSGSSFKIKS